MAQAETDPDRTIVRRPVMVHAPLVYALLLRQDGSESRRIGLGVAPLRLGRGAQNDVVLASPEVSRQHCTVALADDETILTDLDSTNGVYVDGVRVQGACRLAPGARLSVGPFSLLYQCGSASDVAEMEARANEEARAVGYVQALLPAPLRAGPVRAEWLFVPSAMLGGDVFGYHWVDATSLAVFLLDVSGHGVGAALLAASAANMLRPGGMALLGSTEPVAVLRRLNAAFQTDEHNGLFFSLWYGLFDLPSRTLRYASAGHHPAFLRQGSVLTRLATRALPIGLAPVSRFVAAECAVPPGSQLQLFSDGLFEVTLEDGGRGGLEHLLDVLQAPGSGMQEPEGILRAVRALTGHRPFEDDVSVLTLNFE